MIIPNEDLRMLCIEKQWFTEGTISQYDKLFFANEMGAPLEILATIIWTCSDTEQHLMSGIKKTLAGAEREYDRLMELAD